MIKASQVQCFSFIVAECFLNVRATRLLYGLGLLSSAGTLQPGSHPCDRRNAWKIPACTIFNLELDRGRGGWSIAPLHKASHSTYYAVRSQHSACQYGCQWRLHGNMELHGNKWFLIKLGKESGTCMGSPFYLCFCFPQRCDIIHKLGKTHPDMTLLNSLQQFLQIKMYTNAQSVMREVHISCSGNRENCRLQGAFKSVRQDVCR